MTIVLLHVLLLLLLLWILISNFQVYLLNSLLYCAVRHVVVRRINLYYNVFIYGARRNTATYFVQTFSGMNKFENVLAFDFFILFFLFNMKNLFVKLVPMALGSFPIECAFYNFTNKY